MKSIIIGRSQSCDIIINDNFVSRQHAQLIYLDNDSVQIKDLGSSNGTFVNRSRVMDSYLRTGDILQCASVIVDWEAYIRPVKKNNNYKVEKKPGDFNILTRLFAFIYNLSGIEKIRNNKIGSGISFIVTGFILFIVYSTQDFTKTRTYDLYDSDARLGLPAPYRIHMLDTETYIDKETKNLVLFSSLAFFAIGGSLISWGFADRNKAK